MILKDVIRSILIFFHLDLTKNLQYDRLTKSIMKSTLKDDSNCIDIGCFKGEMLDLMIRFSGSGKHFAFEPIPDFYNKLISKYQGIVTILPYALSETNGSSTFHYVRNDPAYSGLRKRRYDIKNPDIEEIEVDIRRLDEVIPLDVKIDFIKIDVEGGEFSVMKGGMNLLKKNKPVIVFECGMGASDYHGTKPAELYRFINEEIGLKISLLKTYISKGLPLEEKEFEYYFNTNKEYYFIAYP